MLDAMQAAFFDAIRGEVPRMALGKCLIPEDRSWAIYRRNYLEGHIAALADTYGSVRTVVGEDYFRQLARRYVSTAESRSGDLNDYGADFAEFLSALLPSAPGGDRLAYLPDVARLDWAWFSMLRAASHPCDWLKTLMKLPEAQRPRASAVPFAILLRSPFPLYRLWHLIQDDGEPVDLVEGGEAVLISRPDEVTLTLLTAAEAEFVAAWFSGLPLQPAIEAALLLDANFSLHAMLEKLEAQRAVKGVVCNG
jgi:hypothetical protein